MLDQVVIGPDPLDTVTFAQHLPIDVSWRFSHGDYPNDLGQDPDDLPALVRVQLGRGQL
jgi:hypothetical protein